jgi:microcystin-dependent protein
VTSPYVGEIKLLPYGFAPRQWAQCNGQTMAIQQNTALFALLGTTYGGNGVTTFCLPDLRGRVAVHRSLNGQYTQGQMAGVENETLQISEMPMHNHAFNATSTTGADRPPTGGVLGASATASNFYYVADSNPLQPLFPGSISPVGNGQPHNNMQPYLVMNYCIALFGVFPSRN